MAQIQTHRLEQPNRVSSDLSPSPKIHPIFLKISNAFLVQGDQGFVLMDCGMPDDFSKLVRTLEKWGVSANNFVCVLLTHAHADHAGCARALQERFGVKIAVHAKDREMLDNGQNEALTSSGFLGKMMLRLFDQVRYPPCKPDFLIGKDFDLSKIGLQGTIVEVPGHTQGSVAMVLDNGAAFIGDLISGGYLNMFMRRTPTLPLYVQNLGQLKKSMRKILDLKVHTIFSGHGGPLKFKDFERFYARFLS